MFWYRAEVALGRPSLVGTTIKCPEKLPEHLLAEEKHTWLEGHKRYLSTTVAGGCLRGASHRRIVGATDLGDTSRARL
jgi:hypothetical protein